MAEDLSPEMDMPAHNATYDLFIHLTVGGIIGCILILICLAAMTLGGSGSFWVGALGLIVGSLAIFVSMLSGLSYLPATVILLGTTAMTIVTI